MKTSIAENGPYRGEGILKLCASVAELTKSKWQVETWFYAYMYTVKLLN